MLPQDPAILFSYINTKLRDCCPSLDALCDDLQADAGALKRKLAALDYHYDPKRNQII